jgi:hypothetical protein
LHLAELHFVNPIVDTGTVHRMTMIPCPITNPFGPDPSGMLILHENANFTAEPYRELFTVFIRVIDLAAIISCSVIIDNLPAQSLGLEALLRDSDSPVIHIKCFAHMANVALANFVDSWMSRSLLR